MHATVSTVLVQYSVTNACTQLCYAGKGLTLGPIDYSASGGKYVPMGSIMVLPGCTAYLFKDYNYEGERLEWIIDELFYRRVICR